ncbi:c-type cytochrome [Roseovarius sp. SCSIO 43702]|uniref:c-type cytochrome n=1 Tax=Roseovarius sp. SCSIO 43702 TaxID=2823043 RepID=UPI001C730DBE|nr:c-type cytochrome [Roseovarius sp. SCSIO 43702]QYX56888.1 c-type cytochrome [Roseovarius sp. SCSIO 43702]
MKLRDLDRRTAGVVLLTLAGFGALAGAAVVAFGLYNVSARKDHLPGVGWALHTTFENAVALRALAETEVPEDLDTPGMVALGAGHYESACKACHGAPGVERSATVKRMLPVPPRLDRVGGDWSDAELHWIVHNGVKMSGMPAWPAERADDVWPVVAFLRAMDGMSGTDYETLTGGEAAGSCAMCHGENGRSTNPHVPRLDILSEGYIAQSLAGYRTGARDSGIMAQAMSGVPEDAIARIARRFAEVEPKGDAAPMDDLARDGKTLAYAEGASESVPSCRACHGPWPEPLNPAFPSLAGQGAPYLAAQLKLWREGARGGGPAAELMFKSARDLDDAEIEALAAYYAALEPASLDEVED